jgi:hypothetical protein
VPPSRPKAPAHPFPPSLPAPNPKARLAPDLVALLEAHGQPQDPNLVRLAEAWREAEQRLAAEGAALPQEEGGGVEEGEEEGEGSGAAGVAEDLEVRGRGE